MIACLIGYCVHYCQVGNADTVLGGIIMLYSVVYSLVNVMIFLVLHSMIAMIRTTFSSQCFAIHSTMNISQTEMTFHFV